MLVIDEVVVFITPAMMLGVLLLLALKAVCVIISLSSLLGRLVVKPTTMLHHDEVVMSIINIRGVLASSTATSSSKAYTVWVSLHTGVV